MVVKRTHIVGAGDGNAALLVEVGGPVQRRVLVERVAAAEAPSQGAGREEMEIREARVAYCVAGRGGTAAAEKADESSPAGSPSTSSSSDESGAGSMDGALRLRCRIRPVVVTVFAKEKPREGGNGTRRQRGKGVAEGNGAGGGEGKTGTGGSEAEYAFSAWKWFSARPLSSFPG